MGSLLTNVTTYEALKEKYNGFAVPTVAIKVNQKELPIEVMNYLEKATVVLSCRLGEMNVAELYFKDLYDYQDSSFSDECIDQYFKLGTPVEIALGYTENVKLFKGYIYENEFGVSSGGMFIRVICKDLLGLLANKQNDAYKAGMNQAEEVEKILTSSPYSQYARLSDSRYINELVKIYQQRKQKNLREQSYSAMTLLEKVKWLAYRHHYECFIIYDQLVFRPEKQGVSKEILALSLKKGLLSVSMRACIGKAVGEAEIRGQSSESYNLISSRQVKNFRQSFLKNKEGTAKLILFDEEIYDQDEASKMLERKIKKNQWEAISIEGEAVGIPELIPGRKIKLEAVSKNMDHSVYLWQVTHEIDRNLGFKTRFEGGMNLDE